MGKTQAGEKDKEEGRAAVESLTYPSRGFTSTTSIPPKDCRGRGPACHCGFLLVGSRTGSRFVVAAVEGTELPM